MLLCMDLATTIGWCRGFPGTDPSYGNFKLPSTGKDLGSYGLAADDFFRTIMQSQPISMAVYESPLLVGMTQIITLRKLYSLCTIFEMVCKDFDVPVYEAQMSKVRSHFVGMTSAPKQIPKSQRRTWLKNLIIEKCREHGWQPKDDNAADALAIWDWACTELREDGERDLFGGRG